MKGDGGGTVMHDVCELWSQVSARRGGAVVAVRNGNGGAEGFSGSSV